MQISTAPRFLGIVSEGRKEASDSAVISAGKPMQLVGEQGPVKIVSEQWAAVGVVEPAARVRKLLDTVNSQLGAK